MGKFLKNISNKKGKLKTALNIVLFIISISILAYFCISNNNLSTLINIIPNLNYFWLFLAIFSMFLSWLFDSFIIRSILSDISQKKYSKFLSFKLTMVGQFFSSITPLGVGGQPMQILYLTERGFPAGAAISVLIRKFLIYQSTMAAYSLLVIISKFNMFSSHIPGFVPLSLIGFGSQCFIVVLLLLFYINKTFTTKIINYLFTILSKLRIIKNPVEISKSIEKQLNSFVENNKSMRKNKLLNFKLYLFNILQFTFLFLVPFLIFKSFKYHGYPVIDMIAAQSFVTMISSYTPLPGAAGMTEGSFLVLFKDFFSPDVIPSSMILCRFITYYTNIIFGFIVIKLKRGKEKAYQSITQLK